MENKEHVFILSINVQKKIETYFESKKEKKSLTN